MLLQTPFAKIGLKTFVHTFCSMTFLQRCKEMSSWLHFDFDDLDSGYVYCCAVSDAQRTIKVNNGHKMRKTTTCSISMFLFQSMPTMLGNSRLLTGEKGPTEDGDRASESTSQVISLKPLCFIKCFFRQQLSEWEYL